MPGARLNTLRGEHTRGTWHIQNVDPYDSRFKQGMRRPPSNGHVAFESLLAELSARFLTLPTAEVDAAITDALRRISGLLGVDRTQLVRFAEGHGVRHVRDLRATAALFRCSALRTPPFRWAHPSGQPRRHGVA